MNGDLRGNCRLLDEKLHRAVNPDMHVRFFRTFLRDAAVYYVDGLISTDFMQHYLLSPLQNAAETASSGEIAGCIRQRVALCEVETFFDVREIVAQLVSGHAVVLADGMDGALSFDVRGAVRRGISPPLTESVVRGPHQGFNESIRDSITLLRRILPTPELIGEMRQIGDAIPVSLCVMYLQNAVDESSLSRLKARLEKVHIDHVLSIGALEQLLEDHPFSLLPQCVMTERPDRAASMLLEGQIVLLLDGSPQVLVLPASLLHLLHPPESVLRMPVIEAVFAALDGRKTAQNQRPAIFIHHRGKGMRDHQSSSTIRGFSLLGRYITKRRPMHCTGSASSAAHSSVTASRAVSGQPCCTAHLMSSRASSASLACLIVPGTTPSLPM